MAINWTCPFCDRPQTATAEKYSQTTSVFKNMEASDGRFALNCIALVCSNVECGRTTIDAELSHPTSDPLSGYLGAGRALKKWRLQPQGTARPLPEYIPVPIREDYYEACLIRDSSPKAAATLIRRAMQGMIRDFCGISKPTLLAEISELKKLVEEDRAPRGVSAESVDAIDHVRGLGNIGAHMEKDISIVVDVDPGEAQALVEVIELLFEEWYVQRHLRQARLARVQAMSEEKRLAKAPPQVPSEPQE